MTERATARLQQANKNMTDLSDEEPLKNELIQIASEIQQCNFNVRQFKKTHLTKPIKLNHQPSKERTVSRLRTEPSNFKNTFYPNKKLDQNLRKSLRLNDTFISPLPSENKSKPKAFFSKSMSGLGESFTRSRSQKKQLFKTRDINTLQKYQQKWNRQKISEKCLEAWLNSILIEFCSNEYFDQKIPNCALKKMGIDENSLVAKGLLPGNVSRLYRGLFVFGMGFNQLIRQLTNGNMQVSKIIWRIYSIVLEYCSKGNLQTVIGEIERDNDMKIIQLTTELQRKQQIIEKNEELNQKKNNEIFKQIKNLRQDNINLNNQKSVLMDQFSSTEQAFSEQIGLRLKFQSKINEIYGLHRELGMKHQRLYHQLVQKTQQLKIEAQKYFQIASRISQYKENLINLREQLTVLKEKSIRENLYLQQANKQITALTGKISNLEYETDSWKTLYKELKVKEKQWQIQRANMEVIVDMRQKSTKQTYKEYQLTLQQNNRLYIMISDQRKSMEQFQKEKKNFNSKIISIVAENSFSKRKLQEMLKKHDELTIKHNQLFKSAEKMKQQNQIYIKSQEGYKVYFDSVQENIAQMHKMNMTQSEQLIGLKQFYESANKIITSKNKSIDAFAQSQQTLSQSIESMNKENQTLRSQNIILQEKLNHSQDLLRVKQSKLQLLRTSFEQRQIEVSNTLFQQSQELQKARVQLEIVLRQYKNQKFERNALNTKYQQTLKIIQSKNQEQKNLRVRISLMEGQISKQKNNYHILQTNMFKMISGFSKQQQSLEEVLQKQRQEIYQKNQYFHPMYIEQMRSHIYQLSHKNQANQSEIATLKLQLMKQKILGKQKIQKITQESRWQVNKIKIQKERIIQSLKNELSFSKEQFNKQKIKLGELEEVAESYRKKIYQKSTSEREQVYKFMLQQKSKQITNLLEEMETLSDALAKTKLQLAQKDNDHQTELSLEQQQFKKQIEEAVRKEISHQFDLKLREAIRSIKLEYSKKQALCKEQTQNLIKMMTIQQILKIKNISSQQLMGSGRQFNGRLTLGPGRQNKWNREQAYQRELSLNRQQFNTRKQMSRMLKNTYKYYQQ